MAVKQLSRTDDYEGFFGGLDNKPAVTGAYQWTLQRDECGDNRDWIERHELTVLLRNIVMFNEFFQHFLASKTSRSGLNFSTFCADLTAKLTPSPSRSLLPSQRKPDEITPSRRAAPVAPRSDREIGSLLGRLLLMSDRWEAAAARVKTVIDKPSTRSKLWHQLDPNGTSQTSLTSVGLLVRKLSRSDEYAGLFRGLNNKPSVVRAYTQTLSIPPSYAYDSTKPNAADQGVGESMLPELLTNLIFLNELFMTFKPVGGEGSGGGGGGSSNNSSINNSSNIGISEFVRGMESYGVELGERQAAELFHQMDMDGSGQGHIYTQCTHARTLLIHSSYTHAL
jgi:hypothetical protein